MFEVATTVKEINRAFYYIFGVSVFFLIGITFTMIWFVIRYNRKRNPEPADIEGHLPLEIAWTVIPTLLALGMFYFGWLGFETMRKVPSGATEIEVRARSFFWTFKYANGRVSQDLYVPVGIPIHAILISDDVNHSFYIPAFRIKEDTIPGRENYMTFTVLREGIYDILCAEYCGTGHSTMLTSLIALSPKDFDLWLKRPQSQEPFLLEEAYAASAAQMERGRTIYTLYCSSCHGAGGKGTGVARARDFTSLQHWKNGAKVSEMFRTLEKGMGVEMPAFPHLPVRDRFAVIHYVRAFVEGPPADSPEEQQALDEEFKISEGKVPEPQLSIEEAMEKIAGAVQEAPGTGKRFSPPLLDDSSLAALARRHPRGAILYEESCARCHGVRGQGFQVVATLDEPWEARFQSLALNVPGRPWRSEDAEALRNFMAAVSVATGGVKPAFETFSKEDWEAIHAFSLGFLP